MLVSVLGSPVTQWISECIKKRHQDMAEKNNLLIEMNPQIAMALKNSQAVSCKYPAFCPLTKMGHLTF